MDIITEGIENALALSMAAPETTIHGIPGISRIGRCGVGADGSEVVYMADNDGDAEQTKKALAAAVDGLILGNSDGTVRVTDTPLNYDAADYAKDGRLAELRQLLLDAKPAALSRDGEIERLAKIYVEDRLSFGDEAAKVARKFSIRPLSALQKAVEARLKVDPPEPVKNAVADDIGPDDMWPDPIADAEIVEVCNTAAGQMGKYVRAHKLDVAAGTMWSLFTHFLHHETIYVGRNPRFVPCSLGADCGKTTALNCVALLAPRAYTTGDTSGPMFAWIATNFKPALIYDEMDKHLKEKGSSLYPIFLYGYSRKFAHKGKMEKNDNDNYTGVTLDTWMAVAGTSIGTFTDAQLSARCIYWPLFPATPEEISELEVLDEDDFCPVLDECRRKFARWAHDLKELPEVRGTKWEPRTLPGKARLNWSVLMRVAVAVGGHWPGTLTKAALRAQERAPEAHDWTIDLLRDTRTILEERKIDRISSKELAEALTDLDRASRDWARLNLNKQSVGAMVNRVLQHCDPPEKTKLLRIGKEVAHGFLKLQMQPLFDRHLPPYAADPSPESEDEQPVSQKNTHTRPHSGVTGVTGVTTLKTKGKKAEKRQNQGLQGVTGVTPLRDSLDTGPQQCNPCDPLLPHHGSEAGTKDADVDCTFLNVTPVTPVTPPSDHIHIEKPETPRRRPGKKGGALPPGPSHHVDLSTGAALADASAGDTGVPSMTPQPLEGGVASIPIGDGAQSPTPPSAPAPSSPAPTRARKGNGRKGVIEKALTQAGSGAADGAAAPHPPPSPPSTPPPRPQTGQEEEEEEDW
jgi:hypothetical protein